MVAEGQPAQQEPSNATPVDPGIGRKWILPGTLILAVLPAYAYFLAHRYEAGVAAYFGYPSGFVSVSSERLFYVLAVILLITGAAVVAVDIILENWPIERAPKWLLPIVLFLSVIAFVILYNVLKETFGFQIIYYIVFSVLLLILMWTRIISPLAMRIREWRGKRPSKKKKRTKKSSTKEPETRPTLSVMRYATQYLGWNTYMLIYALLFVAPFLFYYMGQGEARRQKIYYTLDGFAPYVVLRIYGDNIVAARFERETGVIKSPYLVRKIGPATPVRLKREILGFLKKEPLVEPKTEK